MFKSLAIVTVFAGLLVSAMPHLPLHQIEARQIAAPIIFTLPNHERFFTCTGQFFGGQCAFQPIDTGVCQVLPTGFTSSIRSARPDPGFNCTLYNDATCSGPTTGFSFPYYNFNNDGVDFGSFAAEVDAKSESFKCIRSGLAPPGVTGAGTGIFPISSH
ncbi:hypothetical protein APHAL10511_003455 [Amanita phalloides]|nr:hypothetical protein APHAL10511_003455 [Amanita phalloides]